MPLSHPGQVYPQYKSTTGYSVATPSWRHLVPFRFNSFALLIAMVGFPAVPWGWWVGGGSFISGLSSVCMCIDLGKVSYKTSKICVVASVLVNYVWLFCNSMDCCLPGSSVHGISKARMLKWVAISSSKGSSQPTDWTHISCTGRQILYYWATWEVLKGKLDILKFGVE